MVFTCTETMAKSLVDPIPRLPKALMWDSLQGER